LGKHDGYHGIRNVKQRILGYLGASILLHETKIYGAYIPQKSNRMLLGLSNKCSLKVKALINKHSTKYMGSIQWVWHTMEYLKRTQRKGRQKSLNL